MKICDVIIDMHQGINTVADKVEYLDSGIPIIQSKNFTKGYLDLDDVRYLGEEDEKKYIDKYNPHVGDILMANIGTIGKSYVISEEQRFLIAWNAFLIKPNAEKVKSEFLKFYFDYLASTHYFDGLLTGGTVKFINKKKIGDIVVPDKSIEEQTEICDVLSKIERVIIQRNQELELLDNLIKARFVELFGDPIINPNSYKVMSLNDACTKVTDGTHDTPERYENGVLLLTGKNIRATGIVFDDVEYVSEEDHRIIYDRCNPEYGDVLYTNIGVNYGTACLNNLDYEFSMKNVALLKPQKDILDGHYLWICLNYMRDYILSLNQVGGAQTFMGLATIKKISIPIPPIKLQLKFVEFLEQVDKSKVAVQKSLDETQILFDSLMQKYFG